MIGINITHHPGQFLHLHKQRNHQKRFLTYAFGGPANYSGRGMRAAHQKLVEEKGLNESHFNAVVENLAGVLTELGVSNELIGEVAKVADSVKADVLNQ